ncbi:hypothetical protein OIK40_11610 [Erythrobacter sp. sf7]|uniref:Secreted protein n=1 Tax=Erythrobacter fulvus TaxID=2987523 RepID=A0ABT5JS16_9SPHN|nr:DUF6733 family protein [Erythrobacter fulvus]MDC8755286.1 hypothetical protein [Erythrobacter fulvus]
MTIRFASAASAIAVAGVLSTPVLAEGPAAALETAAPIVLTEKAAARLAAGDEDLAGVTIAASGEATPVILTATGAAPGLAANNGEVVVSSAAIATAAAAAAMQAEENGGRQETFTVTLNQDSFFGFYPAFNGLIPVSENVDFSFYGIIWTTDAFGTGIGSDLWTEFGVGAAIYSGNFVIKPQVGLTNGALLSGGARDPNGVPAGTGGNFADGIVPSLTINYSDDTFEAEYYGGYYAALRNRNDDAALDFLHTWINAGYKFSDNVSAGAHYELLSNTRNTFPGGSTARVYQWVGPYVQFKTSNGFFARFTAGADIESGNDGDFYKLTAGFTF